MPRYRVTCLELITEESRPVEIDAPDREAATAQAEQLRVDGKFTARCMWIGEGGISFEIEEIPASH